MTECEKVVNWGRLLSNIRKFFDSKGFTEVLTPILVPLGAFESTLDCLRVSGTYATGELHTSPEIEMKCLLASLQRPIYQICRSFRDDPPSAIHWPEFTMLEFYVPNADYREVLALTRDLFVSLTGKTLNFEEITVSQAWKRFTGIELSAVEDRLAFSDAVRERRLAAPGPEDSWEDIFFKVMLDHIEPKLPSNRPTILRDYPERLCTLLVKRNSIAERFEVYWNAMEIANGGTELVDSEELRTRYTEESKRRIDAGKAPHLFPEKLFNAMKPDSPNRIPPHAGVAIGLERLEMCLGAKREE